jgi:LacI family transcriptional regulator
VARLRAYREALAAHGIAEDPALVVQCASWTEDEGARGLRELLDSGAEFTAVLGGNDLLALGCYDVLEERGLRCPQDLSVVGFNDVPFVDKLRPPLTSIHVPHQQMGEEAAHLLLDILQNPDRHPRSVLLAPTIAVRQSTAPPRPRPVGR